MAKGSRVSRAELEERITSDLVKSFKSEILLPYDFQFRSSRLPFCPREFVIHHRMPKDDRAFRGEGYQFNFYVAIGSAVHEVVQRFLGISNFLYGSWTCCGVTEHDREGSAVCLVCGRPQKYEELAPESDLGMHVDGVSVLYNGVTEFKTTSSKNLPTLKNPYDQHMQQASCYLHALNEENGWQLDKLIFVYFSRDNPADFRVFVRKPLDTIYQDTLVLYRSAKSDLVNGVLPPPVCEKPSDGKWKGCPYSGICFSPSLGNMLIPAERLVR
jgi:hypothetical protein